MKFDKLSGEVIGLALEVHKALGPGLLENVYQQCLASELEQTGYKFKLEAPLRVCYKKKIIPCGYRIDLLVEDKLIVELKSVKQLHPIHEAQLLTYLKLMNKPLRALHGNTPQKPLPTYLPDSAIPIDSFPNI